MTLDPSAPSAPTHRYGGAVLFFTTCINKDKSTKRTRMKKAGHSNAQAHRPAGSGGGLMLAAGCPPPTAATLLAQWQHNSEWQTGIPSVKGWQGPSVKRPGARTLARTQMPGGPLSPAVVAMVSLWSPMQGRA